jgi:zinc protease
MKKILAIIALSVLFVSGCAHSSAAVKVESGVTVHEEVLPNGLKVFAIKDPGAVLAVFQVWYDAGAINEEVGRTGMSHLLEHMMFKGTPKHGAKELSQIIKRAGGIDNAGTNKDYVYYYQKLAPDRLNLSIELEADRMQNLILDPEEVLSERDVVMEERRMRYDDSPQNLVYEEVVSTAFRNHPYRWPVIGLMQDLENTTRESLYKYYKERYVPNNAMVVVIGNIDVDSVMAMIKKEFGPIPRGPEIKKMVIGEPEQRGERRTYVNKEAELPYVMAAYKTPNLLNDDTYALEVLSIILSGGRSSRIYKSLVDEKQIALSAGAGYSNFMRYDYLFYLYGTAAPGKSIDEVENALYAEVDRLKNEPPSEREVQKAKNQIEAAFIMGQDSTFYQGMNLAIFEMIEDRSLEERYLEGVRNVKAADVQEVAKKYFLKEKRTVGTLIPIKKEGAAAEAPDHGSGHGH